MGLFWHAFGVQELSLKYIFDWICVYLVCKCTCTEINRIMCHEFIRNFGITVFEQGYWLFNCFHDQVPWLSMLDFTYCITYCTTSPSKESKMYSTHEISKLPIWLRDTPAASYKCTVPHALSINGCSLPFLIFLISLCWSCST